MIIVFANKIRYSILLLYSHSMMLLMLHVKEVTFLLFEVNKVVMKSMNQSNLEHLLIEELRYRGALEDIICEYGIETVRVCENCGKLMSEGWIFVGIETYCSDDCLMQAHHEVNLKELKRQAQVDDSETYWTKWEG